MARAYIDMGDADSARGVLEEVIDEGDETQRGEAKRLLEDLD
ncbi:MAG: FimV/HubP family polar landmark protein [Gammaproteobacteria bacterium]